MGRGMAVSLTRLGNGDVVEIDVVGSASCVVTQLEGGDRIGTEILTCQAEACDRCAVQRYVDAAGTAVDQCVQDHPMPAARRHARGAGARDSADVVTQR